MEWTHWRRVERVWPEEGRPKTSVRPESNSCWFSDFLPFNICMYCYVIICCDKLVFSFLSTYIWNLQIVFMLITIHTSYAQVSKVKEKWEKSLFSSNFMLFFSLKSFQLNPIHHLCCLLVVLYKHITSLALERKLEIVESCPLKVDVEIGLLEIEKVFFRFLNLDLPIRSNNRTE